MSWSDHNCILTRLFLTWSRIIFQNWRFHVFHSILLLYETLCPSQIRFWKWIFIRQGTISFAKLQCKTRICIYSRIICCIAICEFCIANLMLKITVCSVHWYRCYSSRLSCIVWFIISNCIFYNAHILPWSHRWSRTSYGTPGAVWTYENKPGLDGTLHVLWSEIYMWMLFRERFVNMISKMFIIKS